MRTWEHSHGYIVDWRQVLSLHELPEAMPELGWLADPPKELPLMPKDRALEPTIDEGYQVRG